MQDFEQLSHLFGITEKCWFANEVSCGVGMRRIDIMAVLFGSSDVNIKIVELKHSTCDNDTVSVQLPQYVKWCSDYVTPNFRENNRRVIITPIVLSHEFRDDTTNESFRRFAVANPMSSENAVVMPTQFVSFSFDRNYSHIQFNRVF
jgi:hypothetical protein